MCVVRAANQSQHSKCKQMNENGILCNRFQSISTPFFFFFYLFFFSSKNSSRNCLAHTHTRKSIRLEQRKRAGADKSVCCCSCNFNSDDINDIHAHSMWYGSFLTVSIVHFVSLVSSSSSSSSLHTNTIRWNERSKMRMCESCYRIPHEFESDFKFASKECFFSTVSQIRTYERIE